MERLSSSLVKVLFLVKLQVALYALLWGFWSGGFSASFYLSALMIPPNFYCIRRMFCSCCDGACSSSLPSSSSFISTLAAVFCYLYLSISIIFGGATWAGTATGAWTGAATGVGVGYCCAVAPPLAALYAAKPLLTMASYCAPFIFSILSAIPLSPGGGGPALALLYSLILYSMNLSTSASPFTKPSSISSTDFPRASIAYSLTAG